MKEPTDSLFSFDLNPTGCGRVMYDGRDISREVRGFRLEALAGEPTKIVLELRVGSPVAGELRGAVIEVVEAGESKPVPPTNVDVDC